MHLLLIEDEIRVQNFIADALRLDGYRVTCCSTYDEVLAVLASAGKDIEIVIMDRLLGRADAVSLLPAIKIKCPKAKILVLSAIAGGPQKAAVLDMGADDYMGKPFDLTELKARIRLLARRPAATDASLADTHLHCGDLKIDLLQHKVWCQDIAVELSNKEYQLLLALARQPGKVLNKFQLLDLVWNTQYDVESNVVEVTVLNLRKALAASNSKISIQSRRNIGYWIEA